MVPLTLICFITNLLTPLHSNQSQRSSVGIWMVKMTVCQDSENKKHQNLQTFIVYLKNNSIIREALVTIIGWDTGTEPMFKLQQKIIAFYNHSRII